MSLGVLASGDEISRARQALRSRGLSFAAPEWKQWLRARRLLRGIDCGDPLKSWDVLRTAEFLEARVPKEAAVPDIGADASGIPPILPRLGYRRVSGLDLNPGV